MSGFHGVRFEFPAGQRQLNRLDGFNVMVIGRIVLEPDIFPVKIENAPFFRRLALNFGIPAFFC